MHATALSTFFLLASGALAAPTPSEHALEDSIISVMLKRFDKQSSTYDLQARAANSYPFTQMIAFGDNLSDNGNGMLPSSSLALPYPPLTSPQAPTHTALRNKATRQTQSMDTVPGQTALSPSRISAPSSAFP